MIRRSGSNCLDRAIVHPLRANRLCWLDTQQSLYAHFPLRDPQSLSCRGIDLAGYRQVIT
jgi:hypothetical protein